MSERILNVNDDEANRYAVTRILRHAGYAVREAASGEEALQRVAESEPALVILDVRLPDMSGFEVCRRIKERSHCCVLHLSALAVDSSDRVTGLEGGADGYLTQPAEPQVLLATVRSLLRLRKAEDDARIAAEHWQASFDALRDGMAVVDHSGRVLRCNRAFAELFHRPMTGERAFGSDGALPEVTALGTHRIEVQREGRWFQVSVDPFEGEREASVVLVLVDVTERKLLERALTHRAEDLADADRRKDDFLAMLAHELRNPLSALSSALELLPQDPTSHRVADVIRRQTTHVARLVDDLLDVSRIRRGRVELRRTVIDLGALVSNLCDAIEPRASALGHRLTSVHPDAPVWVDGDATRLQQVIANLLDNACRYTPYGGRIQVNLRTEGGLAVVDVSDTGSGIPPEMLEKVFDLFTQLNVKIDRRSGGLGIGLTLARNIVEMHGGVVVAKSPGVGKGTTITLKLPLDQSPQRQHPTAPPPLIALPNPSALEILVVEDNEDAREMLKDLLEAWGHSVHAEADGRAGLARALSSSFDVAVIDIGLPLLDGYALAREIRKSSSNSQPYLIALTGYGSSDEKSRSAQAGFDLHLVKPLDVEKLSAVLLGLDRNVSPQDNIKSRSQQRA